MDKKSKIKSIIDRNIRDIILFNSHDLGFISVNKVDISNDYSIAKVYVSFLEAKEANKIFRKLEQKAPFFRHLLASKISLYKTPEIRFVFDKRFIIDKEIDDLLKKDKVALDKIKKKN